MTQNREALRMAEKRQKKERVLHTRISGQLDDELRDRAEDLGLSVSNLVRNILANTFGLVENIVSDSAQVARNARGAMSPSTARAGNETTEEQPNILGWQRLVLNQNAVCATCNDILPKGTDAGLGISRAGVGSEFLCIKCLEDLQSHAKSNSAATTGGNESAPQE